MTDPNAVVLARLAGYQIDILLIVGAVLSIHYLRRLVNYLRLKNEP